MQLCLVRHAIAENRGPDWPDDSERPLTERGSERMRAAARGLSQLYRPDVILTSPYVRARQTAEIIEREYRTTGSVRLCHALATGDAEELLGDLRELGAQRALAVGHEPHISATASLLLTGDPGAVGLVFKKGAAALLSFEGSPEPGGGVLEWLMQPAALRGLAG